MRSNRSWRRSDRRGGDSRGLADGAVFVCFAFGESGPGWAGDPACACGGRETTLVRDEASAPYEPGLLALRESLSWRTPFARLRICRMCSSSTRPAAIIRAEPASPFSSARCSHSRPSTSRTARSLPWASGRPKSVAPAARSSSRTSSLVTGCGRRAGTRPLAVHAAWRTDPNTAAASFSPPPVPARPRRCGGRASEPARRAMDTSDDYCDRRE
jgi:hypothetical protein